MTTIRARGATFHTYKCGEAMPPGLRLCIERGTVWLLLGRRYLEVTW